MRLIKYQKTTFSPREILNKSFLKLKPVRKEFDVFKNNFKRLLTDIDRKESEEFHKNLVADFLKNTYYAPKFFINTKGRNDQVIHHGKSAKSNVAIIIEAKSPANIAQMLRLDKLNTKAMHELILYFLRERITEKNVSLTHIIATNINEWFIFDADVFEEVFAENRDLVQKFQDFEDKKLSGKNTNYFYNFIAKPFVEKLKKEDLPFTYFDIRDYEEYLNDAEEERKLIALYKIFSPEHLLKRSFANDSNTLDQQFYDELLHILGLTEVKYRGKKLIERLPKGKRHSGSLLENAILQLESEGKISKFKRNKTHDETAFEMGIELCITWINRILFLKLLEAQILSYHKGDKAFGFLNIHKIKHFEDLNNLFFQVLAQKRADRKAEFIKEFRKIPYLNSSLFQRTKLEKKSILISNLDSYKDLAVHEKTAVKDHNGDKQIGELNTLNYLFAFLDAYDFSSESTEEIQEENKRLINAAVLGLIFEKINGYKDGSFFTPSFITMYMCRESLRKAVVQRFNEVKNWHCETLDDIYENVEAGRAARTEANNIVNSVKICDPAVGSGHFLVSALNQMIAIKSELRILQDLEGKRLKEYEIRIENDDLLVIDDDGDFFRYRPKSKESQRVQMALFHEKQTIIENCLFGVDININSVKICRLRLWIELLKNAYYNNDFDLETLPNIDINIKCGNSLISRFDLNTDLSKLLKRKKNDLAAYRQNVSDYRNETNSNNKDKLLKSIVKIKDNFSTNISRNSKEQKQLRKLGRELYKKYSRQQFFDESLTKTARKKREKEQKKLEQKIAQLEADIADVKNNTAYEQAFEWRFEFPEVLDEKGNFVGFDVILANPPYFSISTDKNLAQVSEKYQTFSSTGDIYALFIELSMNICKQKAYSNLITSNKWLRANYGSSLRKYLVKHTNPIALVDFGQNLLFQNAIVHTNILELQKAENEQALSAVRIPNDFFKKAKEEQELNEEEKKKKKDDDSIKLEKYVLQKSIKNLKVDADIWNIVDKNLSDIQLKAEQLGKALKVWDIQINFGIKTGYNKAFIIDETTKNELILADKKNDELIKPILRGRDTRRYYCNFADLYLINTHNGYNNQTAIDVVNDYPSMHNYLLQFETAAKKRFDKGKHWTNLRNCAYLDKFSSPKIIFSEIVSEAQFYYDEKGYFPEATVFFISGKHLKYLTALLNSKVVTFLFKNFYMGGELVGKIRYKKAFLEKVPLPIPTEEDEQKIVLLVDKIIAEKTQNSEADILQIEAEIDAFVYQLYDLTAAEIAIVEKG
ncbi:MAG: DUF7149 domain-containing protein [Chitinophagales bacterium]